MIDVKRIKTDDVVVSVEEMLMPWLYTTNWGRVTKWGSRKEDKDCIERAKKEFNMDDKDIISLWQSHGIPSRMGKYGPFVLGDDYDFIRTNHVSGCHSRPYWRNKDTGNIGYVLTMGKTKSPNPLCRDKMGISRVNQYGKKECFSETAAFRSKGINRRRLVVFSSYIDAKKAHRLICKFPKLDELITYGTTKWQNFLDILKKNGVPFNLYCAKSLGEGKMVLKEGSIDAKDPIKKVDRVIEEGDIMNEQDSIKDPMIHRRSLSSIAIEYENSESYEDKITLLRALSDITVRSIFNDTMKQVKISNVIEKIKENSI
jgi:hypothetical protein